MEINDRLRHELKESWHRFLDLIQAERPSLHRYCRQLTGNVWDAEDLVQDTLVRAFATFGKLDYDLRSPRAYLFRLATNAWIDTVRRRRTAETAVLESPPDSARPDAARDVRDAGAALMMRLTPQERAAVVLKDVFDSSLKEIAEVLGTTVGAVKSALHRGRERLQDPSDEAPVRPFPSEALLDRFVAAYNAADVDGLLSLVLENGTVDMLGCAFQTGPDGLKGERSWFRGALGGHPEWPEEFRFDSQRAERATFCGEPIVLVFRTRKGEEALESIVRIEEEEDRVRTIRSYSFCPETISEVGAAMGLRARPGLYRYPTPTPGRNYHDPH